MVPEGFILVGKSRWSKQMFTSQETRKQRRKEPGQAVTPLGLPLMSYLQQPSSDSSKFRHLSKQLQQLGNKDSEIQMEQLWKRVLGSNPCSTC